MKPPWQEIRELLVACRERWDPSDFGRLNEFLHTHAIRHFVHVERGTRADGRPALVVNYTPVAGDDPPLSFDLLAMADRAYAIEPDGTLRLVKDRDEERETP